MNHLPGNVIIVLLISLSFHSFYWLATNSLNILNYTQLLHQLTYLSFHLLVLNCYLLNFSFLFLIFWFNFLILRFNFLDLSFKFKTLSFRFLVFNHCFFEVLVSKYLPKLLISLLLKLFYENLFIKCMQQESQEADYDKQTCDISENTQDSLALIGNYGNIIINKNTNIVLIHNFWGILN